MASEWRRAWLGWAGVACALAAGCGSMGGNPIQRTVDALQGIADLLKTVRDEASATAAIPKIAPTYQEAIDAVTELGAAKRAGMGLGPEELGKLMQQFLSTIQSLETEGDRVEALKGLPSEFWNVSRVQDFRLAAAMVAHEDSGADPELTGAVQQITAMFEQLGPAKVVEIRLQNAEHDPAAAMSKVRDMIGVDAKVIQLTEPDNYEETVAYIGPVDDFDALVAKIDFGEVADQEKARGEIVVVLPDPPADAVQYTGMSEEQIAETKAQEEAAKKAEEEAAAEVARQEALAAEQARLEAMFATPDKKSAEYHSQLLKHLADPQSTFHERAVQGLLELSPVDVADKQIRGEIARQFRKMATESDAQRGEGVRGLVVWGGKYSVPLLLELLKGEQATEVEPILAGLGLHPTAEGAAAAAEYLIEATNREHAVASLTKMGPVAEDAVLAKLPAEDEAASLAGVMLLGDIGTEKSAKILRRAAKSETPEMKEAAIEAYRKIRQREKAAKEAGEEATAS